MSFTLDDMSADALGVGGKSVDLSSQDSAKTATTAIDAVSRRYLLQEVRWVLFRTDLSIHQQLDTASENLQTARVRIRDTDMAEEMVHYSKK